MVCLVAFTGSQLKMKFEFPMENSMFGHESTNLEFPLEDFGKIYVEIIFS